MYVSIVLIKFFFFPVYDDFCGHRPMNNIVSSVGYALGGTVLTRHSCILQPQGLTPERGICETYYPTCMRKG